MSSSGHSSTVPLTDDPHRPSQRSAQRDRTCPCDPSTAIGPFGRRRPDRCSRPNHVGRLHRRQRRANDGPRVGQEPSGETRMIRPRRAAYRRRQRPADRIDGQQRSHHGRRSRALLVAVCQPAGIGSRSCVPLAVHRAGTVRVGPSMTASDIKHHSDAAAWRTTDQQGSGHRGRARPVPVRDREGAVATYDADASRTGAGPS